MYFRDLIGHKSVVANLRTLLRTRSLGAAYLFHGPAGIGKCRAARAFAAALLCDAGGEEACGRCAPCGRLERGNEPNFIIPETEGKKDLISVNSVRGVLQALSLKAMDARWRVFLIDEAERMQGDASNALLKTLEEAPVRTVFILIASSPERLLPTVVSRSQSIRFGPLAPDEVERLLQREKLPLAEARALAALADGRPGEALRLRDSGALDRRREFLGALVERGPTPAWIDAAVAKGKSGTGSLEGARGRSKELLSFVAEPLRLAIRRRAGAEGDAELDELTKRSVDRLAALGDVDRLAGLLEHLLAAQRALDENANTALWLEHALVPFVEAGDGVVARAVR